jgi:GNAT superfamily N-acetyltransferase
MTPTIAIEQAKPDELPTVLALLDEAATWLREQGIEQWPERFSGLENWRTERLRKYAADGEIYLLRDRGEPVATMTFTLNADPDYVHGWPDGPDAGAYVHRMAVRRSNAGHDLGTVMLDWAGAQTAAGGRPWLRLDCSRTNHKLRAYYENRGFRCVAEIIADIDPAGTTHPSGDTYRRGSGALYQRPAGLFIPARVQDA